ncbi:hypothetical protein Vadar_028816 [Vaccinium darrowii]|uniref:Uncharacterized protein n=1 Tax=Vaccinium darrowii TaxID=229202 RepID=A0ACB7YYZ2_9ERIC|nr:hypothetical protein Vadar_028816 [Vaccinium darrowii]
MAALCFSLLLLTSSANSFYYPRVPPRDFQRGDPLDVKVNKLSSENTRLRYNYYDLRYCQPPQIKNNAETLLETLWELIRGDHIQNSMYTFNMMEEQPCTILCALDLDAKYANDFKEKIADEYRVNLILDNLPVVVRRNYAGSKEVKYFIYNHLSFRVMFHKHLANDSAQIVGFEVTPYSINHKYKEFPHLTTCYKHTNETFLRNAIPQEVDARKKIIFTYDVSFMESDIKWESRWDHLPKNGQSKTSITKTAMMNVAWP